MYFNILTHIFHQNLIIISGATGLVKTGYANSGIGKAVDMVASGEDAKKDFEFMIYPGGRHGWGGNKGAHFQNLKTKFIYKYLLEKPVPKSMLR